MSRDFTTIISLIKHANMICTLQYFKINGCLKSNKQNSKECIQVYINAVNVRLHV